MFIKNLGIIGGGQLGSLLTEAAKDLNVETVILTDDINAPAKNFTENFICGNYEDENLINEFISKVDLVTFEFENIPYKILKNINNYKPVLPSPEINKLIQNRYSEKDFLNQIDIRTTKYKLIKNKDEIKLNENLIPGILKTCTLGYDGKGQFKINSIKEIDENIDFNNEYILEKLINLKKEISIIISRFGHQKYELYEPIENVHEDQILKHSKIPADISETLKEKSIDWAKKIVEDLDYIGTLCVEYFIDKNDNLYVNEIAPRVHNSGHLTMNTHNISQFENHVRAVCGLEKIETKKISNGKMINLIGSDISEYRGKTFADNEFFYDYLKTEIRDKRKMGHLTIIENKS